MIFEVSAAQLSCAAGKVRCGECRHVYMATKYLYNDLVSARVAMESSLDSDSPVMAPPPVDYGYLPDVDQAVQQQEVAQVTSPGLGGWDQHVFSWRQAFNGLMILVLSLALGGQYVWFNRDALAANDRWRPELERFCAVMKCVLPLRSDTAQLAILNRDVRQHPVAEDALLINASFENRADFAQRYPVLEISFTDTSGEPVAARRFLPSEYLDDAMLQESGLPAATPVQVMLEVMDPGDQAVSYQFGFL